MFPRPVWCLLFLLPLSGCWKSESGARTVFAPAGAPGDHSTRQLAASSAGPERVTVPTALDCPLAGRWLNRTPDVGESTITIESFPDGRNPATEQGLGGFTGNAEMRGKTLTILFHTDAGFAGVYEWTLDQACMSGEGTLTFTAGGHGKHTSRVQRQP